MKHGVGPVAEPDLASDVDSVDSVEVDVFVGDIPFDFSRKFLVEFFGSPLAVEKEGAALGYILGNIPL